MKIDPLVEEVRKRRRELMAEFDYDPDKYLEHIKQERKKHGYIVVSPKKNIKPDFSKTENLTITEEVISSLSKQKSFLEEKYSIKSLHIFNSYVYGKQKIRKELDILVDFSKAVDLFSFIELENYLSDILGIKVDLIMMDTLKPRIKERILREAISV